MLVKAYKGILPKVSPKAYVAENVAITGDIEIADDVNIWFGVAMRGDMSYIRVGKKTNIQDNAVIHVDTNIPTTIGENVTIGHLCLIHGCVIEDNVLVGMTSTVMNNAVIRKNTIVGAGSLVTEGKEFPEGVLIMGRPAKVIRELTEEEIAGIQENADLYVAKSKVYKADQEQTKSKI